MPFANKHQRQRQCQNQYRLDSSNKNLISGAGSLQLNLYGYHVSKSPNSNIKKYYVLSKQQLVSCLITRLCGRLRVRPIHFFFQSFRLRYVTFFQIPTGRNQVCFLLDLYYFIGFQICTGTPFSSFHLQFYWRGSLGLRTCQTSHRLTLTHRVNRFH